LQPKLTKHIPILWRSLKRVRPQQEHPIIASHLLSKKIYLEIKGYLKYTLSNNLNTIINEISHRFRYIIPDSPSQIPFAINHTLSPNVKKSMDKHNLNYSISVNNSNIIEAIRANTRVEVLERQRNGWVRIRYDNGRIGYVHSNFLSR